jgi:SRSO17 transposase
MTESAGFGVGAAEERFARYLDALAAALGHVDRAAPLRAYCTGLLLPGRRKSVEPMAAKLAPQRVGATHQALHHFVAQAAWSDAAVLALVRAYALPAIARRGPIEAWILDDTGVPKKGKHSVGVARQYCGQVGKQDNCQVAVSLSLANDQASLPVAYRLYLSQEWTDDPERRAKAGVPDETSFQTKPQIALAQIDAVLAEDLPRGIVLADPAYGNDTDFRDAVSGRDLRYCLGIQSTTTVWPPGSEPLPPKPYGGRGRPPTRRRRAPGHEPVTAKALAESLPAAAFEAVRWRAGSGGRRRQSRFAALRVRPAHRDERRTEPRPAEWLLIEWPARESEPSKYWLATLPADTPLETLVRIAKLRWRIERDYQELKQEIGLGHYEGRGWRGFHHHASLTIAAYGFLVAGRCLFSPRQRFQRTQRPAPRAADYRPRGAPATRAP